ncbi:hypothetical protein GCM10023143_16980 [Compostibacter hankyongensis]|uniref:TolC family protein n=2 Tax=Compostibacter hankyongensis TaxID=1007089 RepID=A0ABP8FQV2_9BACT
MKLFSLVFMLLLCLPRLIQAQEKQLEDFLMQGRANSPLLHDYANQVKSLGWDSAKLRAGYGVQVAANSDFMYAPVIHGWGYDPAITNGQNVSALMVVSKEVIGKNNLQTRLNSLMLQQKAIEGQSQLSEQALFQQITGQYIICYSDQQQLILTEEILSFLQKEDDVLRKLTRSSVLKQTDYLTFKVALQQQSLAREQTNIQLHNDLAALNYMCGITDTTFILLTAPKLKPTVTTSFDQSRYAANFRIDSLKNANNAELINLNYKPKVSVFADGGYQSALPREAYKNWGISAGVNITLPVYDGRQRKMSLLQNDLAEDTRKQSKEFLRKQFEQQKMQLMQQLTDYQNLTASAERQLNYTRTLVEADKKQLGTGDIRMTDYLLAVHNYLDLRFSLIQYEAAKLSILNALNYLILK